MDFFLDFEVFAFFGLMVWEAPPEPEVDVEAAEALAIGMGWQFPLVGCG